MLGEKMEEYLLKELEAKDGKIRELTCRLAAVMTARDLYNHLLHKLGQECVMKTDPSGDKYIVPRPEYYSLRHYEKAELIELETFVPQFKELDEDK